jgi:hypothetical protein
MIPPPFRDARLSLTGEQLVAQLDARIARKEAAWCPKLVLDHHGEDALLYATKRADELLERGDPQGYEVWLAILTVIESARLHLGQSD